jgi:hypothetical protein
MNRFAAISKITSRVFSAAWYPAAFALYPVLYLLAFNVGQVEPASGLRAMSFSVLLALLFYLVFWLLLRQAHRSAFLTLLWLVLFFSYGHVYMLILEKFPEFKQDRWLLAGWGVLALISILWVLCSKQSFSAIVPGFNLIVLALVIYEGVQAFPIPPAGAGHRVAAQNAPVQDLQPPSAGALPDVYYFILDSYGRADLFEQAYDYDNSGFLSALQERGFYVAECSQSNYVRTEVSLASSLNMMYLQDLDPAFDPESFARGRLWDSLKHSAVRYNFESLGYKTVNFASGFAWMEMRDAGRFYTPPPFSAGFTEFEGLFLRTTLARHINDLGWVDPDAVFAQNFRDRFNLIFNSLDDIARDPDPTFAYIHIISPHPPFVFGPNGEPTHPAEFWNEKRQYPPAPYARGYQNQLTWLNKQMQAGVDVILENSATPPIIIIQGDHGPWLQPKEKRLGILNVYYLPGKNDKLYPSITPVNSFRLVFNEYFGADYPLLKDVSYFSPVPNLYEFSEIPNHCEP